MNKNLYVIFTKPNTNTGKFIRFMNGDSYSHVSLSIQDDLHELFSFARFYHNATFLGGFTFESAKRYESNTPVLIYKIPINNDQFKIINEIISELKDNSVYNFFSAVSYKFKKRIEAKRSFTCIDFVQYCLQKTNIIKHNKFISFESLENELEQYFFFEGKASDVFSYTDWGKDNYEYHISKFKYVKALSVALAIMCYHTFN